MCDGNPYDPFWFPNLSRMGYEQTSPCDKKYNCIAWSIGRQDRHFWPDPDGFGEWPISEREESIECFMAAYVFLGYERCENDDPSLEPGVEKISLFADGSEPTHAARQLPDGRWTSKMGRECEDIAHPLSAVEGPSYGRVVRVLRKPPSQAAAPSDVQDDPPG